MRRQPKQARSREMVERIVTAGRMVLVGAGYDSFSTNRVAAEAGISPGSLYQYFPDKFAIIDLVIEQWSEEVADRVAASLADRVGRLDADSLPDVMDALVAALEADAPLLRVVLEELPATKNRARRAALERRVQELVRAALAGTPAWDRHDPATAAWVMVLAVENLAVRWVLDRPDVPRDRLVTEMARLCQAYVVGGPAQPAPPVSTT